MTSPHLTEGSLTRITRVKPRSSVQQPTRPHRRPGPTQLEVIRKLLPLGYAAPWRPLELASQLAIRFQLVKFRLTEVADSSPKSKYSRCISPAAPTSALRAPPCATTTTCSAVPATWRPHWAPSVFLKPTDLVQRTTSLFLGPILTGFRSGGGSTVANPRAFFLVEQVTTDLRDREDLP